MHYLKHSIGCMPFVTSDTKHDGYVSVCYIQRMMIGQNSHHITMVHNLSRQQIAESRRQTE
jgi:hypothetical protein